jgi:hypothetical protein
MESVMVTLQLMSQGMCNCKNPDGSWISEMLLREGVRCILRSYCSCDTHCNGNCSILPGDTIYWEYKYPYRVYTRFESATEEELKERGWFGPFTDLAEQFRNDESGGGHDHDCGEESDYDGDYGSGDDNDHDSGEESCNEADD